MRIEALHRTRQAGFTILELMIAASIFAVILLVVAVGVMQFSNQYYKGITSSKTQAATRALMDDISQAIEFSKTVTVIPSTSDGVAGLCIDNALYSYKIGQEVIDSNPDGALHQGFHGIVVDGMSSCTAGSVPSLPATADVPNGSRELLGRYMRLGAFEIANTGDVYTIHIRVLYGDDALLSPTVPNSPNWANEQCKNATGSKFCAVSDLTTTIQRRLL
jgi:prepilin-type N-terminal cleavage/methylation domain-containing protein